jgi:hypothetical protein
MLSGLECAGGNSDLVPGTGIVAARAKRHKLQYLAAWHGCI